MGLSGFVVEVVVVVVGLPIWCWWAIGCGSRFWVDSIMGRGWLQQRCGFWSSGYLSLFVDGLVGLGFWVGVWLRQLMGGDGFGWGLAGFVWVKVWLGFVWVVKDLAGIWWVVWVGVMVICYGIWLDFFGFALSCVFGCGGCGGSCWLLAAVWWLLIVLIVVNIILMCRKYYFNV